jgi:methylated-DNA-[protein]-cysteine S-methyltransferase
MKNFDEDQLRHELRAELATGDPQHIESLLADLSDRAARSGLLDVGYESIDSPLGRLSIAATPVGLVRVGFESETEEQLLGELARRVSSRVLRAPRFVDDARQQLDDYFEGRRRRFELPLDWRLSSGFRRRVLRATAQIPYGDTRTYRDVATAAGSPNATRAAGSALATNPLPIVVPCHRVLRTDGRLGGYRGGAEAKRTLLDHERAHRDGA